MSDRDAIRFVRTLLSLQKRRASGMLEVHATDQRARLSFARGIVVFAEHKSLGRTLGTYLVDHALLTRQRYEDLARDLGREGHQSAMVAFVELAVSKGAIPVDQASGILQGQVERNVVALFEWDRFDCRFHAGEELLKGVPRFPVELHALVMQGVRKRFTRQAATDELADRFDAYPAVRTTPADLVRLFKLQSAELRVARALDGQSSLGDLWENAALDPGATAAVILTLHLAGEIAWSAQRGGPPVSEDEDGGFDSGVRPRADSRPSVRLTLPSPPSEREMEAAAAFRLGRAAMKQGDLEGAKTALKRAVGLVPAPQYALYDAWIDYELTKRQSDPQVLQRLADAARRALVHDQTMAFGYFVVGHLHLAQQDPANAEIAFARAAKLDPTDGAALAEVERLRQRRHGG